MARAKKNDNVDKKMKIKRQKNAISASNSRAQKREEYEAAKNAVKLQKDLHDETIEVANEILSEGRDQIGKEGLQPPMVTSLFNIVQELF
uniref:BZIP domain-containing protein n=1 Tax=Acrobeloides nanus TaxID=290746 RepID=A0A914DNR0_9BILA